MRDYLLFIDTEASGKPKGLDAPDAANGKWPCCLQISWIIYGRDGKEIKTEDHYIKDDVAIEPESYKIHGITDEFLNQHGELRKDVMTFLANDLEKYQPLLVGHFIELDMHMLSHDFDRAGIQNPAADLPFFCTMKCSSEYMNIPNKKFLRLGDLYNLLFNKAQPGQHNALSDAMAVAECFFELVRRGKIDDKKIEEQQMSGARNPGGEKILKIAVGVIALLIIVIILIICLS